MVAVAQVADPILVAPTVMLWRCETCRDVTRKNLPIRRVTGLGQTDGAPGHTVQTSDPPCLFRGSFDLLGFLLSSDSEVQL